MSIEQKVERGANLLDEKVPYWYNAVNTDRLNQGQARRCVVGQLFSGYYHGLERLGMSHITGLDYGFGCESEGEYERATLLWENEIKRRRMRGVHEARTPVASNDHKVTVTSAQLVKAKAHIASVYEQRDAFVEDLTPAGCLIHVLNDLGIKIKVEG
jgi:hypothetical protein